MRPTPTTDSFSAEHLNKLSYKTPFFLYDEAKVLNNLAIYVENLPPQTEICYAMKANSQPEVLETLATTSCSFEVASTYELALLQAMNIDPTRIIFGTAVKPAEAIAEFHKAGVKRYAFDSHDELRKIADNAPGAKVYLRVLVDDQADSVFTMSEKFGIGMDKVAELLPAATSLGLIPYGISFNVGSQARNAKAWGNALKDIAQGLETLQGRGLQVEVINLGGGFPFGYLPDDGIPSIEEIGKHIRDAVQALPYQVKFLAEPGRALVANAYALVVSIFAKNDRADSCWLYVDAGAYNALLEAMSYQGSIQYQIELIRKSKAQSALYTVTGPTGDSLDVIDRKVQLPSDISIGDKLIIRDTGAYSFVLVTNFNGFPAPEVYRA